MDEALFRCLSAWLSDEAEQVAGVVLASVLQTRGATPRKAGSRMLIGLTTSSFSIGGGQAEARVIAAARSMLAQQVDQQELRIDLSGGADAAGICGGEMRLGLRCWQGTADRQRAAAIASALGRGEAVHLSAAEQGGATGDGHWLQPDPALLIVGGGHCGLALYQLARQLHFSILVHDSRADYCNAERFPAACCLSDLHASLSQAVASRALYAVLLNRDYAADMDSLCALLPRAPAFIGMMGSRRRIAQVLADPRLREFGDALRAIQAPIGIELGAQTPQEIAISILAQLIAVRSGTFARPELACEAN